MKQLSTLSLALTFAGCFLGAGYVSGQEIWQFFGIFGLRGIWGLILAMALMGAFGIILIDLARKTGLEEPDKLCIPWRSKPLRAFIGASEIFFMFGVCVIMYAGAGALLEQVIGLPAYTGSAGLCLLVAAVSLFGFTGMVTSFSLLVPCLVIFTLMFSALALGKFGFSGFAAGQASNPLLGGWGFSALTYVSYNLFCSIGILSPLARQIKDRRSAVLGIILGTLFLFLIAFGILCALGAHSSSTAAELPMLDLALALNKLGIVYAALMLMGMFGSALSCHVAAAEYLRKVFPILGSHNRVLTFSLVLFGWLCSLMGFGDLVGTVYPLCGYCGFVALLGILGHYIYIRKKAGV